MKRRRRRRRPRDPLLDEAVRLADFAFQLARQGRYDDARRAAAQALEAAKSGRLKLPRRVKRWICKNCGVPLIPGVNARVRLRSQGSFSYVTVTCLLCGWIHRRPYKVGGGAGEPKGEGEEGSPREPRRDHREEGGNGGGAKGDRQEA